MLSVGLGDQCDATMASEMVPMLPEFKHGKRTVVSAKFTSFIVATVQNILLLDKVLVLFTVLLNTFLYVIHVDSQVPRSVALAPLNVLGFVVIVLSCKDNYTIC